MSETSPDELASKRKEFICGVVEGFYGRPWTTEQRKDLFQKMKKWKMDMYVYAPKDDYKHRAYWRDLYTVEEAEHLTSLISAAKDQGIIFCYALSPGLDITYSSQKEITALKRKLEQVSQFGCTCFALLFDDIEPEMSEADKQVFQSFAHAQVSVTNEIQEHLGWPRFLLCPTQYCATRAHPNVSTSEYLNTLGTKLSLQIDIMWTGPKVISKTLTPECIEEITQVLRRPPVIWDNLHANDYDQNRIFLGPYCGRSPELIPLLRGVLANPNCEYNANLPAVRTLARWAQCCSAAPPHLESVSWDIKLESEGAQGVSEDEPPLADSDNVYHPRQALRMAINEWLPEFSIPKTAQGPVIKPQPPIGDTLSGQIRAGGPPVVPPVAIIPIVPSVNTCMSLTSCTNNASTSTHASIPTVSTCQLQALADVCTTTDTSSVIRVSPVESINPVSNPVMNSLVSPTKVILNESIPNPIIPLASSNMALPTELPVSTLPVPILGLQAIVNKGHDDKDEAMLEKMTSAPSSAPLARPLEGEGEGETVNGGMSVGETPPRLSPGGGGGGGGPEGAPAELDGCTDVNMNDALSENGSMQVEPSSSPQSADMMVESTDTADGIEESGDGSRSALCAADLQLLCELFYLPFEHGGRGLRLLQDAHWLLTEARGRGGSGSGSSSGEWRRRSARFAWWAGRARRLARLLRAAPNQELAGELLPYCCDLLRALLLLHAVLRWCELGKIPPNMASNIQGSYTWFTAGWREAFESGAQEPWVFRGGLAAELRRLLPLDVSAPAPAPHALPLPMRPYAHRDEEQVRAICHSTCNDGGDCTDLFPSDLQSLPADRLVSAYLVFSPEFCMVIEDDSECELTDEPEPSALTGLAPHDHHATVKPKVVGYACAAVELKQLETRLRAAWLPDMQLKYPEILLLRGDLSHLAKKYIGEFHSGAAAEWSLAGGGGGGGGARVCVGGEPQHAARVLPPLLAALRAHGVTGAHACINTTDRNLHSLYTKLGFVEIKTDSEAGRVYLGRTF